MDDLDRFIQDLPKTETHLHIEGALPFSFLRELDPVRWAEVPASWGTHFRFPSFAQFEEELLTMAGAWFTSPERYHEAAKRIFSGLQRQNVGYVETSFASGCLEFMKIDGRATAEAIKSAAPDGMTVKTFLGIHHDGYHAGTREMLDSALGWPHLDGIDIHGDETVPLGDWATDYYQRARDAGKFTKAHAGEFAGPPFVRQVLDDLKVTRLEHGVRVIEDPELVQRLKDYSVTLDVCPLSNVKLRVAPSVREHPICSLHRMGVRCTVSTDDPISFGNSLHDEYRILALEGGFSRRELATLASNGWMAALIPEEDKQGPLEKLALLAG